MVCCRQIPLEGKTLRRGEGWEYGAQPRVHVYETKDRQYVVAACVEAKFWENLCRALGREDFIPDLEATGTRAQEIIEALSAIFRTKTRDEWVKYLENIDTCVSPVNDLEEVMSDGHVIERSIFVDIDDPKRGALKAMRIPINFSDIDTTVKTSFPTFAQHTDEVLSDLGYSKEDLLNLRQQKIIA